MNYDKIKIFIKNHEFMEMIIHIDQKANEMRKETKRVRERDQVFHDQYIILWNEWPNTLSLPLTIIMKFNVFFYEEKIHVVSKPFFRTNRFTIVVMKRKKNHSNWP